MRPSASRATARTATRSGRSSTRLAALDASGVKALAATARRAGVDEGRVDDPWPPGTSPDDDEALRVSSILAARDAAAAIPRDADRRRDD